MACTRRQDHHKMNEADMIRERKRNEDGPDPMVHRKQAEKRPNAADQFRTENQPPSKTLRRQSSNCVQSVCEQNRDIPRLEHELRKKQSLVKVTAIKINDLEGDFDWDCNACAKLATYNQLKKSAPRPRCRDCSKKRNTSQKSYNYCSVHRRRSKRKLRGIHKTKTKKEKNSKQFTKKLIQRSCQCTDSYIVRKESKRRTSHSTHGIEVDNNWTFPAIITLLNPEDDNSDDDLMFPAIITLLHPNNQDDAHPKIPIDPDPKVVYPKNRNDPDDAYRKHHNYTDDNRQRPKRHPSVSSYNSYGSLGQEPMVL